MRHSSKTPFRLAATGRLHAAAFVIAAGWQFAAFGQGFPAKPLRLVVATATSTPIDIVSRYVAAGMSRDLGQNIVVENRPGAGYVVAFGDVRKSPADGYTMAVFFLPVSVAPAIFTNYPIDLRKDFAPVAQTVWSYNVLVVHPSVPANSVKELVALAKSRPATLSFMTGGPGTPAHLAGELFKMETGIDTLHVPYVQFPQGIADLLGGRVQYGFIATPPMIPHIAAGKLRALAVTGPKRVPALKGVPTIAEAGFPRLEVRDWQGFMVKAGTPRDIVDRLNASVRKVLAEPATPAALDKFGADPAPGTPEDMGRLLASEIERWGKVARAANIRIQ
ncbi:MAG: tripartite tricarboxylate transporter substrate binding protein [Burkholderiales bacterium]|nr:tripartite tricarboxylate transporter substrate binding protein [Burkholderiales bacterium]